MPDIRLVKWHSSTANSENFCSVRTLQANGSPQDEKGFNYTCIRLKNTFWLPQRGGGPIMASTAAHLGTEAPCGAQSTGGVYQVFD